MTAITMPVLLVAAALAIDTGSIFTERRSAQALTDLAAITAAANITNTRAAVMATLTDNGIANAVVEDDTMAVGVYPSNKTVVRVVRGHYSATAATAVGSRFEPLVAPFNGAKVSMRKPATLYFGAGLMAPPQITTSAVARVTSEAAFSIGSRLLSINDGILNAVLGRMLGTNLSLRVMDYRALADTDVSAFSFLDALATELHMTAGTYDEVLSSTASVGQIASAMAHIPGLNQQAKVAAQAIGTSATTTLKLKNLIDLGEFGRVAIGEHSAGLDASMSLMDILTGSAAVANGNHQVDLNLGASVPGLLSARLELAIGEPAQVSPLFSIGDKGKIVRTAQTRALVTAGVGGPGGILGTSINLPVYVEVAQAEGSLANIACTNDTVSSVTVNARPGVAAARIAAITPGSLDDFPGQPSFGPAHLVTMPLVSVTGQSLVQVSNTTATPLTFNAQDIANNTARTVTTQNLTQSLTGSLLNNLNLNISVAGLGLGLGGLQSSLTNALVAATPAVDSLLYSVLTALGIHLGQADVRVVGARCERASLVQ